MQLGTETLFINVSNKVCLFKESVLILGANKGPEVAGFCSNQSALRSAFKDPDNKVKLN